MPKPVRKKKRFITRSMGATTFSLVHRSQRDPLSADPSAPQRVLRPIGEEEEGEGHQRKEEQRKFGVYFDDDYDYLQHLRDPGEVLGDLEQVERVAAKQGAADAETSKKPSLPSSVFQSSFEEPVGLLNRAALRRGPLVGVDPEVLEVLETLDDDYAVEEVVRGDELREEFEEEDEEGGGNEEGEDEGEDEEGEDGDEDEEGADLDDILADIVDGERREVDVQEETEEEYCISDDGRFGLSDDDEDEVATKFTQYSMSSSVVPRTEQMATLDDRFEKFFDEYEEENTGALDMDEIEGYKADDSEVMKHVMADFEKEKARERQSLEEAKGIARRAAAEASDEDEKDLVEVDEPRERFDCESIISTYSNLYHHPKMISEKSKKPLPIKIDSKTGIPRDVLGRGLTAGALKRLDAENATARGNVDEETATLASRISQLSVKRNPHETTEEKRERKRATKEIRRERREERKANRAAFAEERTRQGKLEASGGRNRGQKIL